MKGCRPFTDDEVKKLIAAFKNSKSRYKYRDLAWFCYGINCGFRISELLSMRIKDVSYKWKVHGYATVARAYTKGKREGSTKEVEEWAQKYMQIWIDELKEKKRYRQTDFIFQNQHKNNKAISREYAFALIVNICSENGIYGNVGTHSLRKTFTNKMRIYLERKVKETDIPFDPREELQKEGRWAQAETMEHYLSFRKVAFDDNVFDYED